MNPGAYCRDVESYLCRQNGGHLIRIVGPAFELVCAWQARQIPLSVVYRAIDRTVERRASSPSRRRPVRIEFCEADVQELFDEWRRAVGVARRGEETDTDTQRRTPRGPSLPAHLERVVLGLTAMRAKRAHPEALRDLAGRLAAELDAARAAARTARGDRRERLLARLEGADRELLAAARTGADESLRDRLRADAERELAGFRERMPPAELRKAVEAAADRLLREELDLPRIAFD